MKAAVFPLSRCPSARAVFWFIARMEHIPLSEVKKKYAGMISKHNVNKIGKNNALNYKDELLKNIAAVSRNFLQKNPKKLLQVLSALKGIDTMVLKQETIDRNTTRGLVDTLVFNLKKLTEEVNT